ncbi:hypothetical protein EAG_10918 [Camponotus floridanus]|uniref:Uncharacterized protein n=1 Tax=Camponotus floridanus TaxID=104421 RepID=E2ALQ2_CAMFO|nr:hypothetical protein EAG_10918 [Camponotus floridanus]
MVDKRKAEKAAGGHRRRVSTVLKPENQLPITPLGKAPTPRVRPTHRLTAGDLKKTGGGGRFYCTAPSNISSPESPLVKYGADKKSGLRYF